MRPSNASQYAFVFTTSQPSSLTGQLIKDNLDGTFDFHARVSCSSGTYVRTLAEDFGKRLYVGAHLAELRRTRVGDFEIAQAITLDQLQLHFAEESLGTVVLPPARSALAAAFCASKRGRREAGQSRKRCNRS